jgi:hypothetical protein
MRRLTGKSLLSVILVMALLGLPVLVDEAYAQRGGGGRGGGGVHVSGGGGYRGGGMGGGGFQGGVQRPTGGGGSYQASHPGAGGAYQGGTYQKNVNVNVDNNWHGGRYGYGGVAAGVAGAVAVGTVVAAISRSARRVVYGGTTYYVDGNTYYKPCYQGDEAAYCVVENPNP